MSDFGKDRLKDYTEVKDRIPMFYEAYPEGRLVTAEVIPSNEPDGVPRIWVHAKAYRTPDDPFPGDGWSWMLLPGSTPYTRGSEIENTETSAWGRAIGSLGIGINAKVASKDEVDAKAGDQKPTADTGPDGLIGTVITQGTQDFELRQGPEGPTLPFRLKNGNSSFICLAEGPMADALSMQTDVVGTRVTVWGHWSDESFRKGKQDVTFRVLHVERIKTPDWTLPAEVEPVAPGQVAAFDEDADLDSVAEKALA